MSDCIFCKIVDQKIPAEVVYQDDLVVVIKDINPAAPIHLLAIPKKHITSLAKSTDGDEKIYGALLKVCQKVAQIKNISDSGFRVVINTGRDGGQEVDHLHFHLLGGRKLSPGL